MPIKLNFKPTLMNFKSTTLLFSLLLLSTFVFGQGIMEFQSQFGVGSTQFDDGQSIAKDGDSRYVYGKFSEMMDFDPTENVFEMNPLGTPDLFLVKYNTDNSVEWGFQLGRIALNNGLTNGGLAVDPNGDVYISGAFSSLVDFDPSSNSFILTSEGGKDAFLAKYTPAGELIWVQQYGTSTSETSSTLTLDSEGNVVFSLMFTSEMNIDLSGGETLVSPVGSIDAVAIKVNPNGAYLSSHVIGTEGVDEITEIACSADDDMAIGAQINGVSNPFFESDIYLVVLQSDGTTIWDYNFDNFEQNNNISKILFGSDGVSLYVGGRIQGTTQFDPSGTAAPIDPLFTDPFFAKYALSDGSLMWAKYIESSGIEDYLSGFAEAGSALMVAGSFDILAKFDPEDFQTQIASNGGQDLYIAAYDRMTGAYIDAETAGGPGNEHSDDAVFDGQGVVNITGFYSTSLMLDPEDAAIPAVGFNDVFVASFVYETSLSSEEKDISERISIYPVPTSETLYISNDDALIGKMNVEVLNVVGQVVMSANVNMSSSVIKLDVSGLNTGVYILDITLGENRFSQRFVKN